MFASYNNYSCSKLTDVYIYSLAAWCDISFEMDVKGHYLLDDNNATPLTLADNLYLNGELLTELVISEDIMNVEPLAFYGYLNKITSITVAEEHPKYRGVGNCIIENTTQTLVLGCNNSEIPAEENLSIIGSSAFRGCSQLTDITIPQGVTSIEPHAFSGCTALTSVIVPNNVKNIGANAFARCGLTSVTLGNQVESIGRYAFYFCDKLLSVTIPNSVTEIGDSAFNDCRSLLSVNLGEGVETLGTNAFLGCQKLLEVVNNSTLSISIEDASSDTSGIALNAIEVHQGTSKIVNVDQYLFYPCDKGIYLVAYVGQDTDLTLPENYLEQNYKIYQRAFIYCNASSITISDGVTDIGDSAFSGCRSLTNVTIGANVTSIGQYAFENCDSLANLTFANTSGWSSNNTQISPSDLTDTLNAARYLNAIYRNYI